MGYAGYVPAKIATRLTPTQAALKEVANEASYDLMSKVVKNVVVNPSEEKFRKLRLSNPKIAAAITNVPGATEALLALGWVIDAADSDFLTAPKSYKPSMADVRLIEDARALHKKDLKDSKRSEKSRALAASAGGERGADSARIVAQLAADRAERAAAAPVERGSTAQALPNASIRTAGEAGLNSGGCC